MGRTKKQVPAWAALGHAKPVTRREFLAVGVIPSITWIVGPSISSLLLPSIANAGDCNAPIGNTLIPFFTVNLAGGPSLLGQLAATDLNGSYLGSYTYIGLGTGPAKSFDVVKEFGNVEFAGASRSDANNTMVSKFLLGMRNPQQNNLNTALTTPLNRHAALDKTAMGYMPASSQNDTSENPLDITGGVLKLGLTGSKLPNLATRDSGTGVGQQSAIVPPPAPFVVNSLNALSSSLSYSTVLRGTNTNITLSKAQKESLSRLIGNLTATQTRKLATVPGTDSLQNMLECIGVKNAEQIKTGGGDVNPYANSPVAAQLANIWGNNNVRGAMAYNGLMGNASSVSYDLGGYDYHDGTRTTGDQRDYDAGRLVGQILQTAELLQKPCFVYVCADGSTYSDISTAAGSSAWRGDYQAGGCLYFLAYHPTARPELAKHPSAGGTLANQIGGLTMFAGGQQGADSDFPTGDNTDLAAEAIFANYAAWNKRHDYLEAMRIAGDSAIRAKVIRLG